MTLLSQVPEKIETIKNICNNTFQSAFQGKKLKIRAGVTVISIFVKLLRFCPPAILYEKTLKGGEISKMQKNDNAILLITPLFLNQFSKF